MATQMDIFKSLFSMIIIFALCLSFAQNAEGSASTDYDLFEYGIFKVGLRLNNKQSARDGGKVLVEIPSSAQNNLIKMENALNEATEGFLRHIGVHGERNLKLIKGFEGFKVEIEYKLTTDRVPTFALNGSYELNMAQGSRRGEVQLRTEGTTERMLEKGYKCSLKLSSISHEPLEVEVELGHLLTRDQSLTITQGSKKFTAKFYVQKKDMLFKIEHSTEEYEYFLKAKVYNDDDDDIDLWRPKIYFSKNKIHQDGSTELISKYSFDVIQEKSSCYINGTGTLEGIHTQDLYPKSAIFKPGTEMRFVYNRTSEDKIDGTYMIHSYISFNVYKSDFAKYLEFKVDVRNKKATISLFPFTKMNVELEWSEGLKTLEINSKYGDSDTYRFKSKAETKGDSSSRMFSVKGSLTREKGRNDGGSGENFEGAQLFVSRLIQQYIYPSFSYDQFNWNIMLAFPWTSTEFEITFQNNLVGADEYNISINKDKKLALKANLLTALIPSFEVESSYIVPLVKQVMALFRSTPTSPASKPKRRRFGPKKPFIGEPLSPFKMKFDQENGLTGTIGKDTFKIKAPIVAVQKDSMGLLNVSNFVSLEDKMGKVSNPFNFTIERQKESTGLKMDFVSENQMIQEFNMLLKESGVDIDLMFSGNWDGEKTVLSQKFTIGDGILKRGNIRDLFESYLASKGNLELSSVENPSWDCVLGFGGHSRESRTAKFSCDVNKNKLSLELFENLEFKASFYDDKTGNLIVI